MAVETMVRALTTSPIDLAQDVDIAAEIGRTGKVELTLQAVSSGKYIFLSEGATAPAAGSRAGHLLGYRDSATVSLERGGSPFWVWSSTSAQLAITSVA